MELDFGTYDLHAPMPSMYLGQQHFAGPQVEDVAGEVRAKLLASGLLDAIKPRQQIAITAGSRGVHDIATVVRTAVEVVRERGAEPFIVPAMGSHGGATAPGQVELLRELGVTEERRGAPIRATMDVVPV